MYASYDQDVTLVVTPMEHPTNPRGELAFGTIVCWGKHRHLGDFHIYANPIEFLMQFAHPAGVREEILRGYLLKEKSEEDTIKELYELAKSNPEVCILPFYLYEHSEQAVSTVPISCPSDSKQVGWIYITKAQLGRFEANWDEVEKHLEKEVELYDYFVRGDVYEFELARLLECPCCKHSSKEVLARGWNFFGTDFVNNGLKEELPEEYRHLVDKLENYSGRCKY